METAAAVATGGHGKRRDAAATATEKYISRNYVRMRVKLMQTA